MNDLPFSRDILRHAADAIGAGRLANPTVSASVISPVCGDKVTVDLVLDGNTITGLGHEERACVLCQASASILGDVLPGLDIGDFASLKEQIFAMLTEDGPIPNHPWQGYAAFEPVRSHKSRHKCVLLPLEAIEKALDDI